MKINKFTIPPVLFRGHMAITFQIENVYLQEFKHWKWKRQSHMQIRPTHFFCGDCGVEGMWKYVCIQAHIQSACVHGYRNARKRITEVQTMEKWSALIGCEGNRRNRNTSDRLFLFLVFKCGCCFPRFLPFLSISTLSLFFTHFPCVRSQLLLLLCCLYFCVLFLGCLNCEITHLNGIFFAIPSIQLELWKQMPIL